MCVRLSGSGCAFDRVLGSSLRGSNCCLSVLPCLSYWLVTVVCLLDSHKRQKITYKNWTEKEDLDGPRLCRRSKMFTFAFSKYILVCTLLSFHIELFWARVTWHPAFLRSIMLHWARQIKLIVILLNQQLHYLLRLVIVLQQTITTTTTVESTLDSLWSANVVSNSSPTTYQRLSWKRWSRHQRTETFLVWYCQIWGQRQEENEDRLSTSGF